MCRRLIAALAFFTLIAVDSPAREPGWTGNVIARGSERDRIRATPIIHRSYRPFHFYGNIVRRRYYRGTRMPLPRDFSNGAVALVRGPNRR